MLVDGVGTGLSLAFAASNCSLANSLITCCIINRAFWFQPSYLNERWKSEWGRYPTFFGAAWFLSTLSLMISF